MEIKSKQVVFHKKKKKRRIPNTTANPDIKTPLFLSISNTAHAVKAPMIVDSNLHKPADNVPPLQI